MSSKITDLTALSTPASTDVVPVVDLSGTPTTKKSTLAQLATAITLTISQVTGLVAALAAKALASVTLTAGGGLTGGGDLSGDRTFAVGAGTGVTVNADDVAVNYGTTSITACVGNDSRLSDSRTPTAHATSHKSGGSDAIKLDELAAPTDVTTLDATTSLHGLVVKATAPAANVLNVVGIANGETAYTNKTLFDGTNPAALGAAAPGTSLVAAHRDHVHANPAIDTLAAATDITTLNATTSVHGLVVKAVAPAANVLNVVGIANGETVYANKTLFDATNPAALGTVAPGTSLSAAHRDHVHSATIASIIGTGTTTLQGLLDISGASAGQIKFPATQNASSDANTLDDYEEGTWTPADGSGASLTLVSPDSHSGSPFGGYVKIGQMVYIAYGVEYPVTANGSQAKIQTLPFTTENNTPAVYWGQTLEFTNSNGPMTSINANVTWFSFYAYPPTPTAQTNANMSGKYVYGNFQFRCTG